MSSSMISEISPNNCATFLFLSLSSESLMLLGGTAVATYRIGSGNTEKNCKSKYRKKLEVEIQKKKKNPITQTDNSESI
jgi:hypothetical protein